MYLFLKMCKKKYIKNIHINFNFSSILLFLSVSYVYFDSLFQVGKAKGPIRH